VGIKGGNDAQGVVKGVGGEIMTSVGLPDQISGSPSATWQFLSPSLGAMSPLWTRTHLATSLPTQDVEYNTNINYILTLFFFFPIFYYKF